MGKRALFVQDELIYMLIHWHVDLLGFFHPGPVYLLVLMDAKGNGNIKKQEKRGKKEGGWAKEHRALALHLLLLYLHYATVLPPSFCLKPPPADL